MLPERVPVLWRVTRWGPSPFSLESVTARTGRDKLRFRPGILSAIQRPNHINGTVGLPLRIVLQPRTIVRQFTARPTTDTVAAASLRNGQYTSEGPFHFGSPGISRPIGHVFCFSNLL
jgi:hypothetical protein